MDEFTKIVPSAFGPFTGHLQGLFASVKSVNICIQKDGIAMGSVWDTFSVTFTRQTLKIRF